MKNKPATLTLALAVSAFALGASAIVMAQQAMTQPQVHSKLTEQGYTRVHDVEFRHGMWRAKARSADGKRVDIRIDAKTGQVYPDEQVSRLGKHDVEAALETQGYTHVHDVDFDDGMWKAKARNPAGNRVRLRIDAASGKVIGTE